MSNIIGKIIESARANIAQRERETKVTEAESAREIATLQRYDFLKKTRDEMREILDNFKNDIASYSVDALLPGIAVKIRQGNLPQHLLPACMNQLAGTMALENCCAKLIREVEVETVEQAESSIRDFERENSAVLRKHKAI